MREVMHEKQGHFGLCGATAAPTPMALPEGTLLTGGSPAGGSVLFALVLL